MLKKKLSLLDTIISLPVDPAGMMRHLLVERRVPPYLLICPLATLTVLVAPSLWYRHHMQIHSGLPHLTWAVSMSALCTILFFSFFMSVLLKILLLNVSSIKVLAAAVYSMTGLIPFMLAFYLGNFLTSGKLSVLRYLSTGRVDGTDWFVRLFPVCAEVALAFAFLLFANALRAVTNSKLISAISLSVLGVPVLIGSFAMSLTIADSIFPETGVEVYRFFTSLIADPK